MALFFRVLAGPGRLRAGPGRPWSIDLQLGAPRTSVIAVGPELVFGISREELQASRHPAFEGPDPHFELPDTPLAFISNFPAAEELTGFDPDPVIMAIGVADTILRFDRLRARTPENRYQRMARLLSEAVRTVSEENEKTLQLLLEANPWILVDDHDRAHVRARPRFTVIERMPSGPDETRTLIPDLVYDLHDGRSLVVEIESATKRLLTRSTEASYQVPAAPATHASFQISGYKTVFDGSLGAQVKQQLGVADSWTFRYLLVVGSKLQPDFDQRSWQAWADEWHRAGVEVRTWDYYIDRLERIGQSATFRDGSA